MLTRRQLAQRLLRHAGLPLVRVLGGALTVALLGGVAEPYLIAQLIDRIARAQPTGLVACGAILIALYTALGAINLTNERGLQRIKQRIVQRLNADLLRAFYRTPYPTVLAHEQGYHLSRLYDEPRSLADLMPLVVQLTEGLILLAGALALCVWISWPAALVLGLVVPGVFLLTRRFQTRITAATLAEKEAEAHVRDDVGRAIDSYRMVRVFALQTPAWAAVADRLRRLFDAQRDRVTESSRFRIASALLLSYAEMVVWITVGFAVLRGHVTMGGLFGFISAYGRVVNGFRTVVATLPSLAALRGHLDRTAALLNTEDVATSYVETLPLVLTRASIGYGERIILRDVSLTIRRGDRIVITGPNGAGKSTLVHALMGFLPVRGIGTRVLPPNSISGTVNGAGFLPGSVWTNLIGHADATSTTLVRRWLHALGVDYELEGDPLRLSDGQRRKCEIARALAKPAELYVFDEPLAHLDDASQARIMECLFTACADKALIVVLHGAQDYLDRFDRIVHVDRGGVTVTPILREKHRLPVRASTMSVRPAAARTPDRRNPR